MSSISGLGSTSSEISANYLNLLITQLRTQDPTDPLDNGEMASQLAQLSQLSQIEGLASDFGKVLEMTQISQGQGLLGKQVAFVPDGADTPVSGAVEAVDLSGGTVRLRVGAHTVNLDGVQSIAL